MQFGEHEVRVVSGGQFRIDGGAMFGVAPRPVWMRYAKPDEQNRLLQDTVCLLIRGGGRTILVDTGYGGKSDAKTCENYALEPGEPLVASLAAMGVEPADVDVVVLTHLHFDHAGGCTRRNVAGDIELVFPNARHVVQRAEWEDASAGRPELVNDYYPDDFLPLHDAGLIDLIEGRHEVAPGVTCYPMGGHTRGMQVVAIEGEGDRMLYAADLIPTPVHLRPMWTLAFDAFPLDVRRLRMELLPGLAERGDILGFSHDPQVHAARIKQDDRGRFVVAESVDLNA